MPGEVVLDQMCGSGTTLVECKLLGRNAIGVDINLDAIMVCHDRLDFETPDAKSKIELYWGDARELELINDETIDLIATHPPYARIISYTGKRIEGDLSGFELLDYLRGMETVAKESLRVLKPGHVCAILVGDTRKHLHYVPISMMVLRKFLEAGFILKEDVIKLQWKTKTTRERWRGRQEFYKIAHEHLFILRKPLRNEKLAKYKHSMLSRSSY
jgi:DNA modification methylase